LPDFLTELTFWVGLLAATVRFAAPILLAALGETIVERAGVLNIGIEGMMLLGAWAAFLGAHALGVTALGVLLGVVLGCISGLLLAYLCVTRKAHQIVVGITINLFALGLTSFVYRQLFSTSLPSISPFKAVKIPLLGDVPIVGEILFRQTGLVYLAFLLVPATALLLKHTQFGLALSAAGEMPAAVDASGISVEKVRYGAAIIAGGFAGLAGAALSVGQLSQFSDNLTAGRGFFALAVVLLGRWEPVKVMGATFLFAFAEALALRLQFNLGIPHQFLKMLPFVVAILLMAGIFGRPRAPSALAEPYSRE
jgi:simple sugar transport system permease protein